MTIDVTQLKLDISKVIGDQQNQFTVERDLEIKNTVIELTTNHRFYWNTDLTTGLTHTNGVITLPSNTAKVIQLFDSNGNTSYTATPPALFWVRYSGHVESGARNRGNEKPFLRRLNKSTGAEELVIYTGSDTDASLTFSIVSTTYYTEIASWFPDRLHGYFLGTVVYRLLNRVDNPDSQLLQVYTGMASESLKSEINFNGNADFNEYNYKVVNNIRAVNTDSNGI